MANPLDLLSFAKRAWDQTQQPLNERMTLLPFGQYEDGSVGLAWPGMVAAPVEGMQNFGRYGYDTPEAIRDNAASAFDVAGGAVTGGLGLGLAGGLADNALGSAGGKLARGASDLPMDQASRMARAKEMGFDTDTTWYHGANRVDRIVDKGAFDPKRATSGPMAYFSEDPQISSNYAKGKNDTSLPDDGDILQYFTVSAKDLGVGRSQMSAERAWHFLDPDQKKTILDQMKRVGYENIEEGTGPFTLHPPGVDASLSGSHLDYLLQKNRGNPLSALREMWYEGGDLVDNPSDLMDVWKQAGFPHKISDKAAPWYEAPGVIPTHLRMSNPIDTTNTAVLRDQVLPALEQAFKSDRTRSKAVGADAWDKNARYTPKEWVQQLKADLDNNENSYVWTSIPDKVSDVFRKLGYDGIIDQGGKGGGPGHRVAIPFAPNQVRSVNAAFDPSKSDSANLLAANAKTGAAVPLAMEGQDQDQPALLEYLRAIGLY